MARPERLLALAYLLAGPKMYRPRELATRFSISERTVFRDVESLQDLGFAFDRTEGAYRLMDARPLPLTSRERVILALALDNPSLRRPPGLARDLRMLRQKLAGQTEAEPAVGKLGGPDRTGTIPPAIQSDLENAIRDCLSMSIEYTSLTDGKAAWRSVDPWALVHRSEAWYLIARCHKHDEPRTFRLDRIRRSLPIGRTFRRPADFDLERWLDSRWGIFEGDAKDESVIHFDPALAPLIEHAQHHPTESKRRLPDGSIEYRVRVGNLEELARWVVGFGGKAHAVAPPELVESVGAIAEAASAAHPRRRVAAMVRRQRK
jgi:proteasome accessory factor C